MPFRRFRLWPARKLQLRGKTVLITGGSSGIGRACAAGCARDGAQLILSGRRRDALEETARQVGGAKIIEADLTDAESVASFCARILADVPTIDVLVHNAGVGIRAPSYATDPERARQLMALNFLAPVEITRRLLPLIPAGGMIVTVSSIAGKLSFPGMAVYASSKHALNAYANILRTELRGRHIHVLSVCPGYVSTPFVGNMLQGASPTALPSRGRFAITAEQCADAIRAGIRKRKRTVVIPRLGWLVIAAERLFPRPLHNLMARSLLRDDTK